MKLHSWGKKAALNWQNPQKEVWIILNYPFAYPEFTFCFLIYNSTISYTLLLIALETQNLVLY